LLTRRRHRCPRLLGRAERLLNSLVYPLNRRRDDPVDDREHHLGFRLGQKGTEDAPCCRLVPFNLIAGRPHRSELSLCAANGRLLGLQGSLGGTDLSSCGRNRCLGGCIGLSRRLPVRMVLRRLCCLSPRAPG
jgi:hypothetical protein